MAEVAVKFVGDSSDLTAALDDVSRSSATASDGLDQAGESAGSWSSSALTAAASAGKLATGVLAAGSAFLGLQQQIADARNDINDMAARTGVASETIAGLKLAAEGSGQSFAELESALARVAKDGLDISEVAASIQAIEDPAERAEKAVDLLGRSGGKLVQALGDTRLDAFAAFAREFGTDTGPEAAAAAGDWQRAVAELKTVFSGFLDEFDLLEGATTILRDFTRGLIFVGAVGKEVFGALGDILGAFVGNLATTGGALLQLLQGDIPGAFATLNAIDDPGEVLVGAFDRITASVGVALERVAKYNELQLAMAGGAGTVGEALGEDGVGGNIDLMAVALGDMNAIGEGLISRMLPGLGAGLEYVDETFTVTGDSADKAKLKFGGYVQALSGVGAMFTEVGNAAIAFGKINEETGKVGEKAQRRAFAATQAAAVATTIVSTAQAIMVGLASPLPPPGPQILAGVAAATGALSLAAIVGTSFGGGGSAPSVASPSAGAAAAATPALATVAEGGSSGGVTKNPLAEDRTMRRGESSAFYRHREADVVANDGRRYVGGAFDIGGSSGQLRYDRG